MAELIYEKDTESDYFWLYILEKGVPEVVGRFDDREDILLFVEQNYKKAILYIG